MGGTIAYSGKGYKSGELKYTFFLLQNQIQRPASDYYYKACEM